MHMARKGGSPVEEVSVGPAFALIMFAVLAILLTAIGWVASRVLGVRRGLWRSLAAGILGVITSNALIDWEIGSDAPFTWTAVAVILGTTIVLTIIYGLLLDALIPPRRDDAPRGLKAGWRRAKGFTASLGRMSEIARHARAHRLPVRGIGTPQGARALRETIEDSGGMLVKFGQIASTRDDLLPTVVTEELAHLRASVPPLPIGVVNRQIEKELGAPPDEVFARFDTTPLAAASIAVTHRATLHDGTAVIVKVQRPDVQDTITRDARVLRWLARRVERQKPALAQLQLREVVEELIRSVRQELDFRVEQASNAAMRATRSGDAGMRFPEIFADLTTRRVLVMEEIVGASVSESGAVESAGRSRTELADNLLRSFLAQTLVDGVFHADPHPGNVLIDQDGNICLIDYGAVGYIDPLTLDGLQLLAAGFLTRDSAVMARGVRRMVGTQGTLLDIAAIESDMSSIIGQLGGGDSFDPALLAGVARSLARFGVAAPPALGVLTRAALTLQGTLAIIDPGFVMAQRTTAIVGDLARERISGDLRDIARAETLRVLPSLREMPQLAEDLALQARAGRLTIRTQRYQGGDAQTVSRWLDRVLQVGIGMGGALISTLLILAGVLAEGTGVARFLYAVGFVGLVLTTGMLLRALAQIQDRDRRRPAEGMPPTG